MAELPVRDVPDAAADALGRRAEANRSIEAEQRALLGSVLKPGRGSFRDRAAALRAETRGRTAGDSADLIREDRDHR